MKRITMSALVLLLFQAPLWGAIEYQIENTSYSGAEPKVETVTSVVDGERLRMDADDTNTILYHGEKGEIVVIDHQEKTYMVLDKEALQKIAGQLTQAMQQMQEELKKMPPEQREMVERMMKGQMEGLGGAMEARPPREVNPSSERKEQYGYQTARYDVFEGGKKVQELWVADWDQVRGGQEMRRIAQDMATFYEGLLSSVRKSFGSMPSFSAASFYGSLAEIKGFPVVTRDFEEGELAQESVLKSTVEKKVEASYFEPPSGYRKQEMTQFQ